jgi:hypothetical protein
MVCFGNPGGFWKPGEVLETPGDFGNLKEIWKPMSGTFDGI